MTKLYAQEKRVFDINKVTVVGEPVINSDGVVSGFTTANVIRTPEILWGNSFKVSIRFNLSSLPHYACLIGGAAINKNSIRLTVNLNGELKLNVSDDGSTNYTVVNNLTCPAGTISLNNWYDVDVLFDGFSYKIYVNGNLLAEKTADKLPYNSLLQLGSEKTDTSYGMVQGSIDLSKFSITVDNELVYSPTKPTYYLERRKEGFDLSKFTVVGTPTITEYGVASGFSGSDYVKSAKPNVTNCYDFEVISPIFTCNDFPSGNYNIVLQAGTRTISTFINIFVYGQIFTANIRQNGIDVFRAMAYNLQLNTPYQVKMIYKNNQWEAYLKRDNGEFVIMQTTVEQPGYDENGVTFDSDIKYGNESTTNYLRGSINLPSFSITVDGKEVFTGAKEKFYAMQGGM